MRIIASTEDIAEGARALTAACRDMAEIHRHIGTPPLRRWEGGFQGLARIVTNQQLSKQSAAAIWARLEAAIQPFGAEQFLIQPEQAIRAAGLSATKAATMRRIAEALATGCLDLDGLEGASAESVHQTLTAIKGVGPWTADIYLMFCLGHADAWCPSDLALQMAVKSALSLAQRPNAKDMEHIAERWRPWRGVAARMLWAYYAKREKA